MIIAKKNKVPISQFARLVSVHTCTTDIRLILEFMHPCRKKREAVDTEA